MADADLVWENNTTDWLADKPNEQNVADKPNVGSQGKTDSRQSVADFGQWQTKLAKSEWLKLVI